MGFDNDWMRREGEILLRKDYRLNKKVTITVTF